MLGSSELLLLKLDFVLHEQTLLGSCAMKTFESLSQADCHLIYVNGNVYHNSVHHVPNVYQK